MKKETHRSFVSRGFRGRRRDPDADPARVPPGQSVTRDFPVLSAGPTPHTALDRWTFSIENGGVLRKWTWEEFRALPSEPVTADIHCVTRWSKLDTKWEGVAVDTLLDKIGHDARYVMAFSDGGYTTTPPFGVGLAGRAWSWTPSEAGRSEAGQGGRRGWSARTCTSGRAPSGGAGSGSSPRKNQASGKCTAITCTGTHGGNSG